MSTQLFRSRGFHWKLAAVLGAWLVASAAAASASSSNSLVLAEAFERKNAVTLEVPAQALVFQVQIRTATDDWEQRLQEMETARSQLAAAAEKQGFRIRTTQAVMLGHGYPKGLSSLGSGGRSELDVRSNVLLVAELTGQTNLVDVVRRARVLLTRTPLQRGITLGLGEVKLGVEEPEKYRAQLLKRIREHLDATALALGEVVETEVSGFEEPIVARQAGERNVELSLPIRVNYTRKAK